MHETAIPNGAELKAEFRGLDRRTRLRIFRAVERGQAIDDPRYASIAVGYARHVQHAVARGGARRFLSIFDLPPLAGVAILFVGAAAFAYASEWWYYVVLGLVATGLAVTSQFRWKRRARRARKAEEENMKVVTAARDREVSE